METTYCVDCKKDTLVVSDHSTGDTICTECGLVLEARSIDETSEWRTFATDSEDHNDPNRVGARSHPLLENGNLSTFISKPNGTFLSSSVGRWQNCSSGNNRDRSLISAFKIIADMSDRLSVVTTIKDRATEIYKKVDDHKPIKGKKSQDITSAACLYIACREENPRPLREICSAVNGVTEKDIVRAEQYIVEQVKVEMRAIHAGDFTKLFCHRLGMANHTIKAAQEAVVKTGELDIRRAPISVAAGVIYMVAQLSDKKKFPLKDISKITGVAQGTIRKSYKDMYPSASRLIPEWFARGQDLGKLAIP